MIDIDPTFISVVIALLSVGGICWILDKLGLLGREDDGEE
jgi:hypothetical protein